MCSGHIFGHTYLVNNSQSETNGVLAIQGVMKLHVINSITNKTH
jgi:hypothetical protein